MATGHQLWTWPPLGTGAALSCPVVSAAWVVWGSWWHEQRRVDASPARVTLIRERAAQSADHLAEKRQKCAVVGEVVCDLGKCRNTANATTYNSDFPAPHSRQVTTPATRCVQPSGYRTCRVAGFVPCMPWYALLVRTWTRYPEPGQPRPRTEQTAHVRNSGFTCGTRWNPGHCRTQPIHDGSWDSHTQARDAAFTGTRQTRPPTTATFPRRTADKSPPQQHDLSSLIVGPNQLKHRLSRTNKPKSHHKTNT